jgi:hypothetical protein
MAVIMRAAAEYACWNCSMFVISSSRFTPDTDSRAASTWLLITVCVLRFPAATAASTPSETIIFR